MKLYNYWRSSSSYRVRIILELKGVKYTYVPVHLLEGGGQQYSEDYTEISPFQQVPALVHEEDGQEVVITQSVAIAEYIDERFPQPPLKPEDPAARAKVREIVEMVNSGIQPFQNLRLQLSLKALGTDPRIWCAEAVRRGLYGIEEKLKSSAGVYAVGDQLTIADCFLVPQIYAALRFDIGLESFPIITHVYETCLKLPAFAAAHPDVQPDAKC